MQKFFTVLVDAKSDCFDNKMAKEILDDLIERKRNTQDYEEIVLLKFHVRNEAVVDQSQLNHAKDEGFDLVITEAPLDLSELAVAAEHENGVVDYRGNDTECISKARCIPDQWEGSWYGFGRNGMANADNARIRAVQAHERTPGNHVVVHHPARCF
ncbi:MAG: hypothetical protein K5905_19015 [Roseibium sp.]|uniref:hypothetical protein n=1 Tax=Roseibium sp. TaxID=1936156 RepID=UPI00262AEEE6|nr:hypothetical protein [Roseibium sp.]MCV0427555.1 hypothetical protein [Roseibium sp.]